MKKFEKEPKIEIEKDEEKKEIKEEKSEETQVGEIISEKDVKKIEKEELNGVRERIINELYPEERKFMREVSEKIDESDVDKELPVFYPGSGWDIKHALLLGKEYVFVDPYSPDEIIRNIKDDIKKLNGKVVKEEAKGEIGKGGKCVIEFSIGDEKRKLTYYAEDATKIGTEEFKPEELEKGYSVYFVKVPTQTGEVGWLASEESRGLALKNIAVGGFYLERGSPISYSLGPEIFGFEKITSGTISAVTSFGHLGEGNLYRKFRDVKEIHQLLELDAELHKFESYRNGSFIGIDKSILESYPEELDSLKKIYDHLPEPLQENVRTVIDKVCATEEISPVMRESMQSYKFNEEEARGFLMRTRKMYEKVFGKIENRDIKR